MENAKALNRSNICQSVLQKLDTAEERATATVLAITLLDCIRLFASAQDQVEEVSMYKWRKGWLEPGCLQKDVDDDADEL